MSNEVEKLDKIKKSIFSAREANELGLNAYRLKLLMQEGYIKKVSRGVYSKAEETFENEHLAFALAHLGEPSCICLLSALSFYNLTEEIPEKVWVYVSINKYSHLETLRTIRKRNPQWSIGIVEEEGVRITNIERTLVDCLTDRKHFTEIEAMRSTKLALREKKTTIQKLSNMAKKLEVFERVKFKLLLLKEDYV